MLVPLAGTHDFLEVDFDWTSYGSPASHYDPGDSPEVEITSISWEVGITIPQCLWDVEVRSHQYYLWASTMSLSMYCETWIVATEDPMDYISDHDFY